MAFAGTYTLAGLRSELDNFVEALNTEDWTTARKRLNQYRATYKGLSVEGTLATGQYKIPEPGELEKWLREQVRLTSEIAARSNGKRVAVGRTNFSGASG